MQDAFPNQLSSSTTNECRDPNWAYELSHWTPTVVHPPVPQRNQNFPHTQQRFSYL